MKRLFVIFCTIILTFGTIIPSYADSGIPAEKEEKEELISEAEMNAFLEEFGENEPDADSLAAAEGILEELADVAINATNFPDSHLRNYVKENFDKDNDGKLTPAEIFSITWIDVYESGVTSVKGIENFPFLVYLNCGSNNLTTIDVSHNPLLKILQCFENKLTSLNVTNNKELDSLDCSGNMLKTLNLKNNTKLFSLNVTECGLTSLDVTAFPYLYSLFCNGNNIKTLDISKNPELTELSCTKCGLTALDISKCPELEYLYIDDNSIKSIYIVNCPKIVKAVSSGFHRDYGTASEYTYDGDEYYTLILDNTTEIKDMSVIYGIRISKSSVKMLPNSTLTISAAVSPSEAPNKKVIWTSMNPKIATVDQNGKVKALKMGWTKIIATTEVGGLSACCDVQVLFKDVTNENNSAYYAVYWGAKRGIVAGYGTYFDISANCTRAQVVLFLWRAAGQPKPKSTTLTFKDKAEIEKLAASYKQAILWGNENGIVMGFTSGANKGMFKPNDPCTRGQIVTFLWRFAGQPEPDADSPVFPDVPKSHKYYKAIKWASDNYISTGFSDGTFKPDKTCTRGQCVTFMYRLLSYV